MTSRQGLALLLLCWVAALGWAKYLDERKRTAHAEARCPVRPEDFAVPAPNP